MSNRLAKKFYEKTFDQQGLVVFSFTELRDRLFGELVALQDGKVSVQHAMAAAALGRQIQQSAEVQIDRIRELRDDTANTIDGDVEE